MSIRLLVTSLFLGALGTVLPSATLRADPVIQPVVDSDPFQILPEILTPQRAANEAERNRVDATRILTKARILEQRGENLAALRAYQQGYRLTPETVSVLQEIVRLQVKLRLVEEASRYSILLAERKRDLPAEFLVEVANYCIQQGEGLRGARLLERAIALREAEKASTDVLGLRLRLLQVLASEEQTEEAAEQAAAVFDLLIDPEKHHLDLSAIEAAASSWRQTYLELARVHLAAENWGQAEAGFAKAEETLSVPGGPDLHQAELLIAQGKLESAGPHLERYFEQSGKKEGQRPYDLLKTYLEGTLDSASEVDQALIERLKPIWQEQRDNADLTSFLAQTYVRLEAWDQVTALGMPALEQKSDRQLLKALAEAHYRLQQWPELLRILEITAADALSLRPLRSVVREIAQDPEARQALEQEAEAIAQKPNPSFPALYALGKLHEQAGDYQQAADWVERAAKRANRDIRSQLLLSFGLDAIRAKEGEIAERILKAGLDGRPPQDQLPLFQFYLAAALELQDRHDDALRIVKRATLLSEDSALVRSRIAWLLFRKGDFDEAGKEYQRLLDRYDKLPADAQTRTVLREARSLLSAMALKENRFDDAIGWLEEILSEYPEDAGILNDLGYLWVDRNENVGRAFLMIEQAVDADPANHAFRDSMGWAHYRLGNYEQAVVELEKAREGLSQPDPVVLDHLADAYLKLGKRDQAERHLREALEQARQQAKEDNANDLLPKLQEKLESLSRGDGDLGS